MADGRTTDMAERRSAPVMRSDANGDEEDDVEGKDEADDEDEIDDRDEDEDEHDDNVAVSGVSCVVVERILEEDDDKAEASDISSGGIDN